MSEELSDFFSAGGDAVRDEGPSGSFDLNIGIAPTDRFEIIAGLEGFELYAEAYVQLSENPSAPGGVGFRFREPDHYAFLGRWDRRLSKGGRVIWNPGVHVLGPGVTWPPSRARFVALGNGLGVEGANEGAVRMSAQLNLLYGRGTAFGMDETRFSQFLVIAGVSISFGR